MAYLTSGQIQALHHFITQVYSFVPSDRQVLFFFFFLGRFFLFPKYLKQKHYKNWLLIHLGLWKISVISTIFSKGGVNKCLSFTVLAESLSCPCVMTFCWILWLWDDLGSDEAYFELFFDFNPQTFSKYVLFFFF